MPNDYKTFFESLDKYIYNQYISYLEDITSLNNAFLTSPFFYFKNIYKNEWLDNFKDLSIDIFDYIKWFDSDYLFLINNDWFIKNPEFLTDDDLLLVKKIISKRDDFYALNAYVIYYYNKWNLDLDVYFDKLLEIDNNNPYILAKLSRYQASAQYKKYKDNKYLLRWKKSLLLAIDQFDNSRERPTFFYSWLWYIEHELWNYNKSIDLYNKTIFLNKKLKVDVPEAYAWKVFSLNKILKYKESLDLWKFFLENDLLNKYNDKRDFRFFKVLADNYYHLWNYKLFYENIRTTIEKYLDISSFHFSNNLILNLKQSKLKFSWISKNKYESFLEYNNIYIKDDIDSIILSIWYLYLEKLLWVDIIFNDSRWIENICYNYLISIYNGKY